MDPVKEKLNQLKKLASERKAAHISQNDPHEQEKFVKFVRKKLNNFIGSGGAKSPDVSDQRKLQFEKQKNFKLQYQKSVETIRKEKDDELMAEKSLKLQKEIDSIINPDDESPQVTLAVQNEDLQVTDDIKLSKKIRGVSIESESLKKVNHEPELSLELQNPSQTSSKYVNRIKNMYTKERAISTDSFYGSSSLSNFRNYNQVYTKSTTPTPVHFDTKKQFSPINFSDQSTESDIQTVNSDLKSPKPTKSYVQTLLDTFGVMNETNEAKSEMDRLMQLSLLNNISPQTTNNLFDKLREKFVTNQSDSRVSKSFDSRQLNAALSPEFNEQKDLALRSPMFMPAKDLDSKQIEADSLSHISCSVLNSGMDQSTHKASTPEAPTKRKPRGKYQKSKTIDLTGYIFDKNEEPTAPETLQSTVQNINTIKFDKFERKKPDDRLYLTENNRIQLTQGNYDTTKENVSKVIPSIVAPKKIPNQITIQQKPSPAVERSARESTSSVNFIKNKQSKDDLRYLSENNRIRLTLGKFGDEEPEFSNNKNSSQLLKPAAVEPIPVETARPKSILKSPSNVPEKRIGFDDNVDVISIDSTDTNLSIPSFSTNSSILSPATQNFLKVPNMESSIVKNPSLEYIQNHASVKSESPLRSSLKKSGSSARVGRDRSPAPCREIPDLQKNSNIYNNHAISPPFIFTPDMDDSPKNSNNRNRFIKKKLVNRSKSVEVPSVESQVLPKSIEEPLNNDPSYERQALMKGYGMISKNPFMIKNNKIDVPTIVISNDHGQNFGTSRPGLIRQNALTKSLGDNLNTIHDRSSSYNPRYNRESPRKHSRRHSHHHHKNDDHRRRRSRRVSSSLSSSLSSENSLSRSSSQTSTSSSDFDPRRSTLNMHRMNRSRHNEHEINKMININRTRNSKTEEKQLRNRHMDRVNYSSDDSVCGIPKPSARRLCSGSKPFHKSMDELSYTKSEPKVILQHTEHPYAYKEISELSKNRTLPINPHVLSPPPLSYHQEPVNNINNNNFLRNDIKLSESNMAHSNSTNFSKNLNQFNEYQKQKQESNSSQKSTYNAHGHVIHPGLKSVSKNLPSYSEITRSHIDEKVNSVNTNKTKAPTFRGQIIENSMSEKNKINSNFQLNLKNKYLPYQQSNNTQSQQNVSPSFYDQKRISSLSPSTMDMFNDTSNPTLKTHQQFTQKPLPNYSAYINRNNNKANNVYSIEPTPAQKNTRLYHQHQNFLKISNNNSVKERSIETKGSSSAINRLKFQQSKSKSFDTGPGISNDGIDNNSTNNKTSGYSNLYAQSPNQEATDEMPQSAAIQEKLKRFETKSDTKPFSLSNHVELSSQNKLGRALIDENKKTEYPVNSASSSFNRRSPFETNKENSPFTNKPSQLSQNQLNMFQASTPSLTQSTSNTQFNQNSQQAAAGKPYLKQPSLFLQNMGYGSNKTGLSGLDTLSRNSPGKNVFNTPQTYKYSQYSTPTSSSLMSQQFSKATSTPPVINNSLTAATAAASEALSQTSKPQNSLLNKKAIKSDYSIAQMATSPVYNDNYEYMSLQHNEREKSLTASDYNSLESTSQTPSIVSKRAAIFEQKLEQRNLSPQFQNLEFSRGSSFNRSNFSPINKISKFDDPAEVHSSSGNSSTSFKENKRPISLHDSHSSNHKKVQPAIDHGKESVAVTKNENEPHQMSISDKMKMFSTSQSNSMHNKSLNVEAYEAKANKSKRNANRFQTQPVSLADFEIANDNYVSQISLPKPLVQPQQSQQQIQSLQQSSNYKTHSQDSTRDRVLTLNDYRFSGSSLSASTDSTSSPSSLTSSTSSTSNNDHIPHSIVQNSINNLKLEQTSHVQPFGSTKQNQLNTVSTSFTRNSNKGLSFSYKQRAMTNEIEIITSKTPLEVSHQLNKNSISKSKAHNFIAGKGVHTAAKSKVQIINDRFETNSESNLINSNSFGNRKITTMENSMPDQDISENNNRETKFYKPKADAETFMSLPAELKKQSPSRDNLSDNENTTEMMSIKDRMAALKKNNSVEWRKQRSPAAAATASTGEENTNRVSVKQQQMQLKQQLLMATPNTQTPYQMLKNEQKNRDVLAALDNNDESSEEKKMVDSNQSLDKEETPEVTKPLKQTSKDGRRLIFNAELEKALQSNKNPATARQKLPSLCGGSDSDHSMLMKNATLLGKSIPSRHNSDKIEMFSTDSEMDSFFKDTEAIGKSASNYRYNDLFSSSCGSPSKTDENDLDDDFDKIVTGGQRLTQGSRAKPARKTKSKGNHLKSLQSRTEVSTDYDEQPASPSQPSQPQQMNITAEFLQKKLNKSNKTH